MSRLLRFFGAGDTAAGNHELQTARLERILAQSDHDQERSINTQTVAIASRAHRRAMHEVGKALQELNEPGSLSRFTKNY